MSTQPKRLYRSRTNRVIAGVCGGFAEYSDIDPTLVRIVMILLTIFGGWGILLYIAALIIVPLNPVYGVNPSTTVAGGTAQPVTDPSAIQIIGITMVVIGFFVLFINLDFFSFRQITRFIWSYFFPAALIGAGIYILMRRKESEQNQPPPPPPAETTNTSAGPQEPEGTTGARKKRGGTKKSAAESQHASAPPAPESPPRRQLMRSILDRKFFGICGGLGEYFDIDPTIVRILFIIFTLMSFGFGVLLYIVLLFSMPEKPRTVAT